MTKSELIRCYETEIAYQKHMLENLGRWMTLFLAVTSLGFLLIYFFNKHIILLILGFVLNDFWKYRNAVIWLRHIPWQKECCQGY